MTLADPKLSRREKTCGRAIFLALLMLFLPTSMVYSRAKMSEPKYKNNLKVEFVRVPMRDGVELAAKIVRPNAEGRFPGVMMYYPYRFLNDSEDLAFPWPVGPNALPGGKRLCRRSVRGPGDREFGGLDQGHLLRRRTPRDGYEMVEWIADQPWCNGNVGMIGISYGGVVQWQVAVQAPPSLKAIIVPLRQRRRLHRVDLPRRRPPALHVRHLLAPHDRLQPAAAQSGHRRSRVERDLERAVG